MTIGTAATPLSYNGDDVTTDFAITWKYFAKSDVVVTYRDAAGVETVWVLDTDYSLTAAGVDAGGTLTALVTTPATGGKLVITLEPPNIQSTAFPRGGIFPASNVEDAFDIASQRDAKIESLLDRMLRVPITDALSGSSLELPNETDRASKYMAFDSSGAITATSVTVSGAVTTAFVETLLDDADADAFWATLMATITKSTARSGLGAAGTADNNTFSGANAFTGANTVEGSFNAFADTGAANAYVITPSPAWSAYATYQKFTVAIANANTGACTININSLGAKNIKRQDGSDPIANEIQAGLHTFMYDGTNVVLLDPYPVGQIVQVQTSADSAVATGTTLIPADDTIPQNTEGDQYLSVTITPKATTNILIIDVIAHVANSVANTMVMALFQDTTVNALAAVAQYQSAGTGEVILKLRYRMAAGTTAATTFKVRAGGVSAGTLTFNGTGGGRQFGGVADSSITVQEIAV